MNEQVDDLKVSWDEVHRKVINISFELEKSIRGKSDTVEVIEKLCADAENGIGTMILLFNLMEDEAEKRGVSIIDKDEKLLKAFKEFEWLLAKYNLLLKYNRESIKLKHKHIDGYA